MKKQLPKIARITKQVGFTMIELLIVISILGILAVAVLSAINPIEQINRGRDTGSQSDAEQLISAIDRYYASNGTYPWQGTGSGASSLEDQIGWAQVNDTLSVNDDTAGNPIRVLNELVSSQEIKNSFVERIDGATNPLYIWYDGVPGDSVYVCFNPLSNDFRKKAANRCQDTAGAGLPADLRSVITTTTGTSFAVCGAANSWTDPDDPTDDVYYCLP